MRLTLLNSPLWPDPNANRGKHLIHYWLYPHRGDWREAKTKQRGYEVNNKIICFKTDRHEGELPLKHSYIQISPDNIILTTIKFKEGSENELIVVWYESQGQDTETKLTLPFVPVEVKLSNFLEDDGEPVMFKENTIELNTKAHQVVTLKIRI